MEWQVFGTVPEITHTHDEPLKKVEAKEATCKEAGNKEYYICESRGTWYEDAKGQIEITDHASVIIPIIEKPLKKVEAKEATCKEAGNKEYYICESCGTWYEDAKGQIEITDHTSVIIPVVELPYEDVEESEWYYDVVCYNYCKGTMTGKEKTIFAPNEALPRAQFASILYRIIGAPDVEFKAVFGDVTEDAWFAKAVVWAYEAGVISGYDNGNFGPDDIVTREQMAIMMHNYAKVQNLDVRAGVELDTFEDGKEVSWYAEDAVKWAVGAGILLGKDNGRLLDPAGPTTRAECAAIIQRFMETCTD